MHVWIEAVRPKTLSAAIAPVLLGVAAYLALTERPLDASAATVTLTCTLLMQIGTNLVNDYFDHLSGIDGAERLGPRRATAGGLINPRKIQRAYRLVFLAAFLLGLYLISLAGATIAWIGLAALVCAYIYTAGPYPLSHHGMGELFAYLFFGPIAVFGSYYIQAGALLEGHFSTLILLGSIPGLVAATLMAVNNIRDYQSDKLAAKKTLIVIFGQKAGRTLALGLIALSMLILIYLTIFFKQQLIIAFFVPCFFAKTWRGIYCDQITYAYNQHLANTGKFLFIYSLIISLCIIF